MLNFWLMFGAALVFAEFILPGLVSIFIGLGALTVAAFLHYNVVESIPAQLITWFVSSTIYIFSLRLLVIKIYPSDTDKINIDEEEAMIGQIVDVIERIEPTKSGRIEQGESTWVASANEIIEVGEKVKILGRKNITWRVEKIKREEI